jgi:hypothetical protein
LGRLIRRLPRESATVHAMHGEDAQWGLLEQLQAATVDALHAANWQRAGRATSPRPKQIPRPGVRDPGRKKLGTATLTMAEIVEQQRRWATGELAGKYVEKKFDVDKYQKRWGPPGSDTTTPPWEA